MALKFSSISPEEMSRYLPAIPDYVPGTLVSVDASYVAVVSAIETSIRENETPISYHKTVYGFEYSLEFVGYDDSECRVRLYKNDKKIIIEFHKLSKECPSSLFYDLKAAITAKLGVKPPVIARNSSKIDRFAGMFLIKQAMRVIPLDEYRLNALKKWILKTEKNWKNK